MSPKPALEELFDNSKKNFYLTLFDRAYLDLLRTGEGGGGGGGGGAADLPPSFFLFS